MRHNWKNLSFDLREGEPESEVLEVNGQPQEEPEDLDQYVQEAETEETESIETVKQVLRTSNENLYFILIYIQENLKLKQENRDMRQELEALKEQMRALMLTQGQVE